jgi:hypothetical protein
MTVGRGRRRIEGFEDFVDVTEQNPGIFEGGGLNELERLSWKPVNEGIQFDFSCHSCGRPLGLVVEWEELVALKYGMPPAIAYQFTPARLRSPITWVADREDSCWRPDIVCRHCNDGRGIPLMIGFTEPEMYLRSGRAKNPPLIIPAGERSAAQECVKVQNMLRQQRQQQQRY